MTQAEIKEKIRPLLQGTYLYRGNHITLYSFREDKGTYTLHTSEGNITKDETEIVLFIELLSNNPKKGSTLIKQDTLMGKVVHNNEGMFDVIDRMIKKVEDDPSFIPQANAVNDLLKTKIEATKTAILASKI